nr:hypothetical protein [Tanacetum cinerariifolium]
MRTSFSDLAALRVKSGDSIQVVHLVNDLEVKDLVPRVAGGLVSSLLLSVRCGDIQSSMTSAGLAGGSFATGTITVPEVIDDCMSPQRTDNNKDETNPPATLGTRSLTSKSLTNQITEAGPHVGLFVNHIRSLFKCDFVSLDSILRSNKSTMDNSFTLGSTEEAEKVKIL